MKLKAFAFIIIRRINILLHYVAGDCRARTLAICNFLERCGNAVRTPLTGVTGFFHEL